VVRDTLLLFYAAAVGFVSAGITASFYRMVTAESPRFGPLGGSFVAWVSACVLVALAGPVIVIQSVLGNIREKRIPRAMLAAGVLIAGMWSGCIGILVLELAFSLRESLV